jgi:hypothetical protein
VPRPPRPEGARLDRPDDPPSRWADDDPPGTTGDPQHDDPESIPAWTAAFDGTPVSEMTDEEYPAFDAVLAEQRADGLAARMAALDRRPG